MNIKTPRTLRMLGQAGFSLIELMVVVAIIGLLATVAIPQFTKFQNRAKQSEVQTHLSGIATAEQSFAAQWNQYYGMFDTIGYLPVGKVRYNCNVGGAGCAIPVGGGGPAWAAGVDATFTPVCPAVIGAGNCYQAPATEITWTAAPVGTCTVAAKNLFTAVCSTTFLNGNGGIDTWQINETQIVTQTVNGI